MALRIYTALGPSPLDSAAFLRVGIVGGESASFPVGDALRTGVVIPVEGDGAVHQVRLDGLDLGGTVVARGDSAPIEFVLEGLTNVDIVFRPVGAFSGGLHVLTGERAVARTVASGAGGVFVVGASSAESAPDHVARVDPWLTTVAAREVVLGVGPSPVLLPGLDDGFVLVVGSTGSRFSAGGGDVEPVAIRGAAIRPGSSVEKSGDAWFAFGGIDDDGHLSRDVVQIDLSDSGIDATLVARLEVGRYQPLVARAGGAIVVVGGAPAASYGEIFGGATFVGPTALPTAAAEYGRQSAVFLGDGTTRVMAFVAGVFGEAGTLALPRHGAALCVLTDGSLLVAGGGDTSTSVTAERLVLGSDGHFASVELLALLSPRVGGSLTLLPSGGALLAGGNDPTGAGAIGLEVYTPRAPP